MNKRLILGSPVDELVDRLYEQSAGQTQELMAYFSARAEDSSLDWNRYDARTHQFLSDKLVALDRDKAEFCYQVCRALGARRVVEAGTSFGVSTLFLAAAVRDNLRQNGGGGVVIGTEYTREGEGRTCCVCRGRIIPSDRFARRRFTQHVS